MRFVTITLYAVASRLVALAIAKPIPDWKASGIAIPLTREASFLNYNKTIDIRDAISSHGISVEEKILSGLDNYKMNTGAMHPFAVKRIESGLGIRGANVPLTVSTLNKNMWTGEISIGTPPKTLKMYIDTGAAQVVSFSSNIYLCSNYWQHSDMWVLQTGCIGISGDRNVWDPKASQTSEKQGPSFELYYAAGTIVKGDRYTDNVTIGGFTVDPQTFGSATSFAKSRPEENEFPVDGLLGLAFPSISKFGVSPLFTSLLGQNKVINPTISFKLTSSGAEMYLGGANSMLYNGDITYTHVTAPGYWQVSMDDVRVNGHTILENIPVIFDTGASFIYGDWNRVAELYGRIGGSILQVHQGYGFYSLPCDSFPTVGFTFGGKTYKIPLESLRITLPPTAESSSNKLCFSRIVARLSEPIRGLWSVGLPFLQGVYSVFDYGTLEVGFAKLA